MTTYYCSQCGAKLEVQARFCHQCGTQVSPMPKQETQTQLQRKGHNKLGISTLALIIGGLLLIAGAMFSLFARPVSAPEVTSSDDHDETGIPYSEVERLSLAQAKARYDNGTAVFVDVRTQEDYESAHISGAISMPLAELQARYRELPEDMEILTYCT